MSHFLVVLFLGFWGFYPGKPQNCQGFSVPAEDFLSQPNPQNPWKRKRKHQNNQGKSLLKIHQGNQKNQAKEGQGWGKSESHLFCRFSVTFCFFEVWGGSRGFQQGSEFFAGPEGGCSSSSLRDPGKHSATGVL